MKMRIMKSIDTYIIEKLHLDKDIEVSKRNVNLVDVEKFEDIMLPKNNKEISTFLKGKFGYSSLDIGLINLGKYIHIFRYEDMHRLELSVVYNDSSEWPKEDEWSKSIKYDELDDRMPMKDLFADFYNFLKDKVVK